MTDVDTTGWDIDWIKDTTATILGDISAGIDRELTFEETEAVQLDYWSTGIPGLAWSTQSRIVAQSARRMYDAAASAVQVRDLAGYVAARAAGCAPTGAQRLAHVFDVWDWRERARQ